MWAWFVVFYSAAVDDGAGAAYAAFAVIGVGAAGCLVGGILGDRIGRPQTTALAMGVSGTCALLIGLFLDAPAWVVLAIGLVWGATIWLMPFFADAVGWRWAFAFLAPGPALGVLAMLRLRAAAS